MTSSSESIRAFIAIRTSDEVESNLAAFIESLRAARDGIAWTRRQNLHLTLKFVGPAVDPQQIAPLIESLRPLAATTAPFELHTRAVGGFPNLARPRVIWAGLESPDLSLLAREVDQAASRCGFAPEQRPFSPHLTLARVRTAHMNAPLREQLESAHERDFGASRIESMSLYRSQLTSGGSIYTPLASFSFGERQRL